MADVLLCQQYTQPQWDTCIIAQIVQSVEGLKEIPEEDLARLPFDAFIVLHKAYTALENKLNAIADYSQAQRFQQDFIENGKITHEG